MRLDVFVAGKGTSSEVAAEIAAAVRQAVEQAGNPFEAPPCCASAEEPVKQQPEALRAPFITPVFAYGMGRRVRLTESGEKGVIVGRAEYHNATNSYFVRYVAGDGRQTEAWWPEDAIEAVTA